MNNMLVKTAALFMLSAFVLSYAVFYANQNISDKVKNYGIYRGDNWIKDSSSNSVSMDMNYVITHYTKSTQTASFCTESIIKSNSIKLLFFTGSEFIKSPIESNCRTYSFQNYLLKYGVI
jgi:hypothetical protein